MNLFAKLMEERLPALNSHLTEIYADLNLIGTKDSFLTLRPLSFTWIILCFIDVIQL